MRGPHFGPMRSRPSRASTSSRWSSSAARRQLGLDLGDGVQEPGLLLVPPRLGLAHLRQPRRADQLGGTPDQRLAVAEVRAEADVREGHGRSTVTALNSTGRPAGTTSGLRTRTRTRSGANRSQQRVGEGRSERFEQPEPRLVHLADRRRHLGVVDRVRELVVGAALADLQLDVVEEPLAVALLLRVRAVEAVQLEPAQLDLHAPATALAAASASTCSRTSCARRIVAPRS